MTLTLLKEKKASRVREGNNSSHTEEVMAFCPRCKALQTVWLNGSTLMPTRKFTQVENQIYHNCGSTQPCRLYINF